MENFDLKKYLTEGEEDTSKVKEVKQLLYRIEELAKNINTETPKNRGGLGIKDASLIDVLVDLMNHFKEKNYL